MALQNWLRAGFAAVTLLLSATAAMAQPLYLTPESQRSLVDNGGAIGFMYQEERIVAEASEIAALGVTESLTTNSPLRAGDVVLAVNDRTASTASVLRSYVGSLQPGSKAVLTVMRAGNSEPKKVTVAIVNRSSVRIPGLEAPPSSGTIFARSCVTGAVAGVITTGLTLLIAPIDGGFTFAAFAPKAVVGAIVGCAAVGTGGVVAAEAVPSQNLTAYRRIM